MNKRAWLILTCISSFVALVGFTSIQTFHFPTPLASVSRDSLLKKDSVTCAAPVCDSVYQRLELKDRGLSLEAFRYSWEGFRRGNFKKPVMAIVDFSQSSRQKRLYVIDLQAQKLLFHTYVSHGRNSGEEYANVFSNRDASYQSSLGFYRTLGTYQGKHGLSLKLEGLEEGINHRALSRAIVMHGAAYVSEQFIRNTGRLGRSQGCPAVSVEDAPKVIQLLTGGAGLFLYYPDPTYFKRSKFALDASLAG